MAENLLASSVKRITVETAWLPPIVVDDPFKPAVPGAVSQKVGAFFQPRVVIDTALGPIVSQPWGRPTQNWPLVKTLGIGLGILFAGVSVFHVVSLRDRARHRRVMSNGGLQP